MLLENGELLLKIVFKKGKLLSKSVNKYLLIILLKNLFRKLEIKL